MCAGGARRAQPRERSAPVFCCKRRSRVGRGGYTPQFEAWQRVSDSDQPGALDRPSGEDVVIAASAPLPNQPDLPEQAPEKRPWLVWFIFFFYVFSLVVVLLLLVSDAAAKARFEKFDLFYRLSAAFLLAMNTTAAIFLFRLRKRAVDFFVAAIALRAVIDVRLALLSKLPAGYTETWVLVLMVLLYAMELRKRGVLR